MTSPLPADRKTNQIAIVGMSCILPGAPDIDSYWTNICAGVDAVREPRAEEWNASFYREKSSSSFGKIYCTKAGFITESAEFDPIEFGIMPSSVRGGDPDQFLALRAAAEALRDAGYSHKSFDGERAEIIIGRTMAPGVGSLNLIQHGQTVDQILAVVQSVSPHLSAAELADIEKRLRSELQPCNSATIPAVMPNILSGRIANKLGFRGRNLVLDAACASSLIALEMTIQSLISGQADLAIAGGVHINSSPYFSQMFCELGALSISGTIRPFDDEADGTVLGEGVAMVVVKRFEDAVKDKNKIYAIIRGIGSSSDGRGSGSLAPNAEGEALAMKRAYEMSAVSPRTIELLEAHGTGTRAGDKAELSAIESVFSPFRHDDDDKQPWCALGTVKSMIGHTQAAAGMAGLIKTALALHNKTLPGTLHFSTPTSQINWADSPCYVITESKAWAESEHPRRAAVSAFGFGGINAHAVLEEYVSASGTVSATKSVTKGSPKLAASTTDKSRQVKLDLSYPAITAQSLQDMPARVSLAENSKPLSYEAAESSIPATPLEKIQAAKRQSHVATTVPSLAPQVDQDAVLRAYMQALNNFQKNSLGVQEKVMMSYLTDED